jgi:methionine-gamma-lyase
VAAWEETEDALVFNSGTAAAATIFLQHLRSGDLVLFSNPIYGGTATLLRGLMTDLGVTAASYGPDATAEDLEALIADRDLAMIWVETPANPTNDLFDLAMVAEVAQTRCDLGL